MAVWLPSLIAGLSAVVVALIEANASRERKKEKEDRDKVRKERRRIDALEAGVESLLRDSIISRYNKYMAQGYIPIYGMENVDAMYKSYHTLGGDGTITKLVEEVRKLPSKPTN